MDLWTKCYMTVNLVCVWTVILPEIHKHSLFITHTINDQIFTPALLIIPSLCSGDFLQVFLNIFICSAPPPSNIESFLLSHLGTRHQNLSNGSGQFFKFLVSSAASIYWYMYTSKCRVRDESGLPVYQNKSYRYD